MLHFQELCDAHNSRHSTDPHRHVVRRLYVVHLPSALVTSFFTPAIKKITSCLRDLRRNVSMSGLKYVFLVGGFSSCPLLQASVRAEIEGDGCIVPPTVAPDLAIVKGAVLYATAMQMSKSSMTSLTHGVPSTTEFARHDADSVPQTAACPYGNETETEATALHKGSPCVDQEGKGGAAGPASSSSADAGKAAAVDACNPHKGTDLGLQLAKVEQECMKALQLLADEPRERAQMDRSLAKLSRDLNDEKQRHKKTNERLAQFQSDLERTTVLLKKEQQEKKEISEDRNRYRDQANRRLLAQGTDIQAAFPTASEIGARVERALTGAVIDWFEMEDTEMRQTHGTVPIRQIVADLFLQCQALVNLRQNQHTEFFLGGASATRAGNVKAMGQDTADFMRQHLRRHYTTLFPLVGAEIDQACKTVLVEMFQKWAVDNRAYYLTSRVVKSPPPSMANVIKEYLHILVTATIQNPPVVFSDDCGKEQPFDPSTHSQPIDGDAIRKGESCIVVFPCMMQMCDDGSSGFKRLTKKFILRAVESSS